MDWQMIMLLVNVSKLSILLIYFYVICIVLGKIPFYIKWYKKVSADKQKDVFYLDVTYTLVLFVISYVFVKLHSYVYQNYMSNRYIIVYIFPIVLIVLYILRRNKIKTYCKDN